MTALFCLALGILVAGYINAQQPKKKSKPKSPPPPPRDVLDEIEGRQPK